ncbi:Mitochondrial fission protein [Ascosphaera aggregata]|nr:Mitochondrial fission protein [Ascosphaera aggregata]
MDSRRPTNRDESSSSDSDDLESHSDIEDMEPNDSLLGTSLTVRQLEAFGRKVTTTANQLIGPANDQGRPAGQHYHSAIRHIHKEMRSPALQRRVFGFAQTTPTDLVRSKLSRAEIHQRALASVPDELLRDIPEDTSTYSLFQGFKASIPDADTEAELRRARRKRLEAQKLLNGPNGSSMLPESLKSLKAERNALGRKLDMMGVRKNMCSAEIKEIDNKIANLHMMRKIVLDRLAELEMDETDLENEMNQLDIKLEDLEEEVANADSEEITPNSDTGDQSSPEFMSKSIYGKLSASSSTSKEKAWKTKALRMCQPPKPPRFPLHASKEPRTPIRSPRMKDTLYTGFFEEYLEVDDDDYYVFAKQFADDDVFMPTLSLKINANHTGLDADTSATGKRSTPILHGHFEPGSQIQEIKTHNDTITALDFDVPFGTMVTAALDDTLRVWDLNLGKCMGHLDGHTASVRCLQVEDNIVASGSMDASIRLWDLSRLKYSPSRDDRGHSDGKSKTEDDIDSDESASTSTEQEPLASSPTPSRTPPLPEGDTSDCPLFTLEAHVDEVTALHFRNETLISGSADKTLRQWDLVKGRCVQTLDVLWAAAQASSISNAAGTTSLGRSAPADADFVGAVQVFEAALAAGTADGMVRLWDLRSGQVHRSLVGHTGPVTCLQYDDVHLVTGSLDRSIRIWDLRTGSIFDAYAYDKPITSMMFDTRRIASAAGEDVVKVYDKTDGRHWDCGAGLAGDAANTRPSVIEKVRIKDGYMVEGRRDGTVGSWTC